MDRSTRLSELAEEMENIAIRLQSVLAGELSRVADAGLPKASVTGSSILTSIAERELHLRTVREFDFEPALFGEPAWNILLDLYVEASRNRQVSVSSACLAARVPPTTGLRWIAILEREKLIVRKQDNCDSRRTFVELTTKACFKMQRYLILASQTG